MTEKNTIYSDSTKVENGIATLIVNEELSPGVYTIIGNYPETDNYQEGEGTGTLNISTAPTQCTILLTDETLELGNSTTLTIQVSTTNNTPIHEGTVTIYEDNTPIIFNQNLNETGTCTVNYAPSTSGTHQISAHYNGVTGTYAESTSESYTINVTKTPTITILKPNIIYSYEPTIYKARVTYDGQPVNVGQCVIRIDGKTVKDNNGSVIYLTPDNDGYVEVNTDIFHTTTTKTATLQFTYPKNNEYASASSSQSVTVYAQSNGITPVVEWDMTNTTTPVSSGNYHIRAIVTRQDGYPIADATVSITCVAPDGTSWQSSNQTTNSNGEIDVVYPNDLVEGEYTINLIVNGTTTNGTAIQETTSSFNVTVQGAKEITENLICNYILISTPSDMTSGLQAIDLKGGQTNTINSPLDIVMILDIELSETDFNSIDLQPQILFDLECIDANTSEEYKLSYYYSDEEENGLELVKDEVSYSFNCNLVSVYKMYDGTVYHLGIIISMEDADTTGEIELPSTINPQYISLSLIGDNWYLLYDDVVNIPETWWIFGMP